MSTAEEATINPDGSQSSEIPNEDGADMGGEEEDAFVEPAVDRTLLFLALAAVFAAVFGYIIYSVWKKKKEDKSKFEFFDSLEQNQFNIRLPPPVEEYYQVKEQMLSKGWKPGQGKPSQEKEGPGRAMGQALMKRAIADIPLIHHMQKEAQGMYRLHNKNMCSEVQWKTFQGAEAMVSGEVEEVRVEAEEIEPGWSQVIWRQAAQYHGMLKQQAEQKQAKMKEEAVKRAQIEKNVAAAKATTPEQKAAAEAAKAEKMAKELLADEERNKSAGKAFGKGGAVKSGFLDGGGKGKKK